MKKQEKIRPEFLAEIEKIMKGEFHRYNSVEEFRKAIEGGGRKKTLSANRQRVS
jgi:hypothetical protein